MRRPADKDRLEESGLTGKSSYQAWQKVLLELYSYFGGLSIWAEIRGVSDWLICRIYPELPFEIDRNSNNLQPRNRVILARSLLL